MPPRCSALCASMPPLFVALLAALCACARPPAQSATSSSDPAAASAIERVVVVTIDGLMPAAYLQPDEHGLRVPTLRGFVAEGAYSEGTRSVFPSATYPAHSSIATGTMPRRHGIFMNRAYDPWNRSFDAWNWYAEDLRAKPLWQAVSERGLSTALVNWPVSVGARVDFLVPEYWRAKQPDDLKLTRALSTPGLLAAVQAEVADFWTLFTPPEIRDRAGTDVAVHVLTRHAPTLLMLHIFEVDGAQHKHGIWSEQARAAIENADAQLARVIEATERAGTKETTAFVVASDHGFRSVERQVHPNFLLREAGLVQLDDKARVSAWDAYALSNGGAAYVYVREPADEALRERARALFVARAGIAGSGIARVLEPAEVAALGGDPSAVFALEAEAGAYFGSGYTEYESVASNRATHGWDPAQPEMLAALLMRGPGIAPQVLRDSRLIDIAPTIADWLGVALPEAEGRALIARTPARNRPRP